MKVEIYPKRDSGLPNLKVDAVSVNLRSNFLQITDKEGVIHGYNTDEILHYHVE